MAQPVTLNDLAKDRVFRAAWDEVLRIFKQFNLNEIVLDEIYRPKTRAGFADELNKQAAIDMWRLEGSLEIWQRLLGLADNPLPQLTEEERALAAKNAGVVPRRAESDDDDAYTSGL